MIKLKIALFFTFRIEFDRLVYQFYGLTEEEIRIVEGNE